MKFGDISLFSDPRKEHLCINNLGMLEYSQVGRYIKMVLGIDDNDEHNVAANLAINDYWS